MLNRRTSHRLQRINVDAETEKPVERDDQVKAHDPGPGGQALLEPEEIAAAVPEAFNPCADVDALYLDRPRYVTPAEASGETSIAVIRDGLARRRVVAVARTVLFRRVRSVTIPAVGDGLVAHTPECVHEVRSAAETFKGTEIDQEMLELAQRIIKTERGKLGPSPCFEDRCDDALAELVKAKAAGKPLPAPKEPKATEPTDLMQALRDSASAKKRRSKAAAKPGPAKRAAPRRKAG